MVDKYCANNGRMAESPIRMLKYLLLKIINAVSDADVVESYRYNISFKYFWEMASEEATINSSSLTKFSKPRLKETALLNLSINKALTTTVKKRDHLIKINYSLCYTYFSEF